jgi:cyclopropane fatty-acyl-phospholipid synthase-like methyltransferase
MATLASDLSPATPAAAHKQAVHRSPGIIAIYNEVKLSRRNRVLDLGSSSGASFNFFAQLSCHIHFESIDGFLRERPELLTSAKDLREGLEAYLSSFDPENKFDIILAWDIFNYLDSDTLRWLMERLNRHCHPNTLLHSVKYLGRRLPAVPRHFQILDQYRINISGTELFCSRPFPPLDTAQQLKHMPDYVMEHTFMQQPGMEQQLAEQVLRYRPEKDHRRQLASAELSQGSGLLMQQTLAHRSYGLEQVCARLRVTPGARVLDLGSRATRTADFFLEYAEEVYSEDILPALMPNVRGRGDASLLRLHALNFDPQLRFDLVLAWDVFNFCSSEQLQAIFQKLKPHLAEDASIFAFFYAGSEKPERSQKCYVLDDKNLALVPAPKRRAETEDLTAVAVLRMLGNFHLANTYILRPGMQGGLYEYIFRAGDAPHPFKAT